MMKTRAHMSWGEPSNHLLMAVVTVIRTPVRLSRAVFTKVRAWIKSIGSLTSKGTLTWHQLTSLKFKVKGKNLKRRDLQYINIETLKYQKLLRQLNLNLKQHIDLDKAVLQMKEDQLIAKSQVLPFLHQIMINKRKTYKNQGNDLNLQSRRRASLWNRIALQSTLKRVNLSANEHHQQRKQIPPQRLKLIHLWYKDFSLI